LHIQGVLFIHSFTKAADSTFLSMTTGGMDKESLIREIIGELKRGRNVVFVAHTGWGKTRMAFEVAAILAREGHKMAMFFPTATLAMKKWRELVSIIQGTVLQPSAILTVGAQQYCIYRWQYPQKHCRRCVLYRPQRIEAPSILTYSELENIVPEDACGYWIQEELFPQYNIVLGHYGRAIKISPHVDYIIWDEAQELFIPSLRSVALSEIAEVLNVDTSELTDVNAIKEYAEAKLIDAEPIKEDVIYSLLQMLRLTCWIEDGALHCLELRQFPSNIPSLMLTATPPPGWPPEGWGRKIEIRPQMKPKALIEKEIDFFYKDGYQGLGLYLYMLIKWAKQKGAKCIIIFAISSARRVIEWNLPFQVSYEPPESAEQIPPSGVVVADAWGKMRVGVDIAWCDFAVVLWPSLHVVARRRMKAEGRNPDVAELLLSVQLSGRIMRPRPGERPEDVPRRRLVALVGRRFWQHREYLSQHFEIEEMPAEL